MRTFMLFAGLALALTTPSAVAVGDWAATGETNLKVLKHTIATAMKFNDPSQDSVAAKAKLTQILGTDYEPTFSQELISDDKHIGMKMKAVNGKNALVMFRKVFHNIKFEGRSDPGSLRTEIRGMSVDVPSKGKVLYSHIAETISGVTDAGKKVPGTTVRGFQQFERYTFDDKHKITDVQLNAQAEAVEDIQRKVRAYEDAGKVGLLLPTWPKAAMLAIVCMSILSSCLLLTTTTAVVVDITGEKKPLMGFAREQATQVTEDEINTITGGGVSSSGGDDGEMDI